MPILTVHLEGILEHSTYRHESVPALCHRLSPGGRLHERKHVLQALGRSACCRLRPAEDERSGQVLLLLVAMKGQRQMAPHPDVTETMHMLPSYRIRAQKLLPRSTFCCLPAASKSANATSTATPAVSASAPTRGCQTPCHMMLLKTAYDRC